MVVLLYDPTTLEAETGSLSEFKDSLVYIDAVSKRKERQILRIHFLSSVTSSHIMTTKWVVISGSGLIVYTLHCTIAE